MTNMLLLISNTRNNPNMFERLTSSMREKARRKALKKQLLKMDDHLLRDMGIGRHDVLGDKF